jgi:hypothetical protein
MDGQDLIRVVLHPTSFWTLENVDDPLVRLRACEKPEDYFDVQAPSSGMIWAVETKRAGVSRTWKRMRRNKPPSAGAPKLSRAGDPSDLTTWELEEVVLERSARQLRCVGDALA